MKSKFLLLLALIALIMNVSADEIDPLKQVFPIDGITLILWSFGVIAVLIIISLLMGEKIHDHGKKLFFIAMVAVIAGSTLYLAGETVYENIISESGGPIHWHADFEIWVCGEKIAIQESEGLENKIGTAEFHHHNDYRIHVEGTVVRLSDISVGNFFKVISGEFSEDTIKVIQKDGSILEKHNGDECNGVPGKVKFYVYDIPNNQFGNYIMKPYSLVPPGDVLKIVFE